MSRVKKIEQASFQHEGNKIVLPVINGRPMSYTEAISALERQHQEEEKRVSIHHIIKGNPLDGLVAFNKALKEIYGFVNLKDTPGFFGPRPPQMLGIPTGPNGEMEQVPYGQMTVPGMEGYLQTHIGEDAFLLLGETKRKFEPQVAEIVKVTKRILKEDSIYKGKAIKVDFEWKRLGLDFDPYHHAPQFMEVNPELEGNLIFAKDVQDQLNIGLFAPIELNEACRKYQIPLKRGILLSGKYGTGKTLTANVTATKATRKGWTFIYLKDVRDLKEGLDFAAQYAPAVLFAEDIDRVMTGDRSAGMDQILNTLDGVDTKKGEIITVFTTNHIEKINPAVLRMGRLDTLIEVLPPNAEAAEKLVRLYARNLLSLNVDLKHVAERLAGKIPAFIREVTERAKISAIIRLGGGDIEGHVTEEDLMSAARVMENHDNFLKPKVVKNNKQILVALDPKFSEAQTQEFLGSIPENKMTHAEVVDAN